MLPVDLTLSSSPRSPSSYSPSRMGSVAFPTSSTAAPPPASLIVTTCTGTLTHPTSTQAPRASLTYRCRTAAASSTPRSSRSPPVPNVEDFEVKGGGSATSCHHPLGGLHRGPMGVHTRTLEDEMSGTGRALRVGEGSLSDSIILYAKHGAARHVVAMLLLQRMRGLASTTWKQWWGSLDRRVLRRRFLRLERSWLVICYIFSPGSRLHIGITWPL